MPMSRRPRRPWLGSSTSPPLMTRSNLSAGPMAASALPPLIPNASSPAPAPAPEARARIEHIAALDDEVELVGRPHGGERAAAVNPQRERAGARAGQHVAP